MKEITAKQKKFCEYYIGCGNATEAALKAGYKESYARDQIHKLLQKVGICRYIEELNKKIEKNKIASITEIQEFWTGILKSENYKITDRLKASELLGKSKGAFLDRLEVDGGVSIVISGEDDLYE